jgi:quercetin dioxygenase-like cupin family protein
VVNPYVEERIDANSFYRIFDKNVVSEELVWHRDHSTRVITIIEGEGWLLQLDNRLPIEIKVGEVYTIPANTYHRVKRGLSDLKIMIQEI